MVNWGALIEVPIAVILLWIAVLILDPIQIQLFGVLQNSVAFPHGASTELLIQLIPLLLAVLIIWGAWRAFREPEQPTVAFR